MADGDQLAVGWLAAGEAASVTTTAETVVAIPTLPNDTSALLIAYYVGQETDVLTECVMGMVFGVVNTATGTTVMQGDIEPADLSLDPDTKTSIVCDFEDDGDVRGVGGATDDVQWFAGVEILQVEATDV